MILKRDLLKAVIQATTDDETRYSLDHVQVHPDGRVVATNGHFLLSGITRHPDKDEDFPVQGLPEVRARLSKPTLLARTVIDKLLKAMPTGKRALSILQGVLVAEQPADGGPQAYAAVTDLEAPVVAPLSQEDLTFPSYDRVMVKADRPHIKLTLSAALLAKMAKAAEAVNDKGNASITFEVQTNKRHRTDGAIHDQVRFVVNSPDFDVTGVIMPTERT